MTEKPAPLRQRLDKWLWAARFFKTRRLATDAVDGGKVKLNDLPAKPSREIACGDKLDIMVGELRWTVCVRGINEQRRPAPEARLLYAESPESIARRAQQQEIRQLAPMPGYALKGRPTKKAGRLIRGFNE
jgi:ribosome-associated heat shock protein Hsp15